MARPHLPGQEREHACKHCGNNSWRQYTKGEGGKKVWYCMPCNRGHQNRLRSDVAWTLWNNARHRARRQGIPFGVTVEDVRAVWPANGCCAISGDRFSFLAGHSSADTPSLERKDTAFGFAVGNIFVISNSEAAIRRHRERAVRAVEAGV